MSDCGCARQDRRDGQGTSVLTEGGKVPSTCQMLKSMTGFGTGRARVDEEELAVELKSLNHKFCEVKARLPRELSNLEAAVVKQIKERLSRGSVEVLVKRQSSSSSASIPSVDVPLAKAYVK